MNKKMFIYGKKVGFYRNLQGLILFWLFAILNIVLVYYNRSILIVTFIFIIISFYFLYILCFSEFYFVVNDVSIYTTNLFNKKFKIHFWSDLKTIDTKEIHDSSESVYLVLKYIVLNFSDKSIETDRFTDLNEDENIILIVNTPENYKIISETIGYDILNNK